MDKQGEIVAEGKAKHTKEAIQSFFAGISSSRIRMAIEACSIWRGVYRLLTELGYEVLLASPLKTHQIAAKKKTDKVDSKTLADLLRTGYLPEVYIPSEDVMNLRDIARHRARLVSSFTHLLSSDGISLVNIIFSIILSQSLPLPNKVHHSS